MADRTHQRPNTFTRIATCLVALSMIYGCATPPAKDVTVTTKGRAALALESLQDEMLRPCEGMPPTAPPNTIGDLLADSSLAMSLLAECMRRHARLSGYIKPLVEEER